MNNKEEKLKKILFDIINKLSKDADVYHHNGSLWLIHTEDRKWIVEYTKEQTLWFNYNFFRSAFKFVSLDINDKTDYVTEWFESRFLDKPKVEDTNLAMNNYSEDIVDAIENGVKETLDAQRISQISVENTIQNGVKETSFVNPYFNQNVEDTIENGVKHTMSYESMMQSPIEYTIQNGVKETELHKGNRPLSINDTIQNGIKKTDFNMYRDNNAVKDTIENGVKETKENKLLRTASVMNTILDGVKHVEDGVKEIKSDEGYLPHFGQQYKAKQTIQNGVKDTFPLRRPTTLYVEDAIKNGVKKTYSTLRRTKLGVDDIIQNGVKDTKPMDEWVNAESIIEDTIEYGVKELQPLPAQDGNRDWGNYYRGKEDRAKPFNEYLDEAIIFGVKEVIKDNHHRTREVVVTIKDGVKETHQDCSNNIARVEGIIRVGEKLD